MKPPFEIYNRTDIADQNGHVCTCEDEILAKQVLQALRAAWPVSQNVTPNPEAARLQHHEFMGGDATCEDDAA